MSSFQPQAPDSIGRYKILRLLGSGAMGDVFLAQDPHIDRQLAIKTVRVVGGTELDIAERKQRLLREARAAGKLLHPNVVALFDADEAHGVLYLAFEFVDGVDLAKRAVSAPPLSLRQVLQIVREVATALEFAHRYEIVHRDIKPSNILLGPGGEAKVADFGIAKLTGSTELTRTGSVVGSPQYMSPEQVRGEALDGRSDLFSLGVVLYELLCRTRPFTGDTISTLVFEILAKEPPTVDQLRPGLPARLVNLVHRLLAKDRQHRPSSGQEVQAEIDQILVETPAAQLDSPAGPPDASEGETIRMPSSGGVPQSAQSSPPPLPPIPSASVPPAPPSTVPGAAPSPPTATLPSAPPTHTSPVQPAPPPPGPATGRATPLDSGTYGRPGRNTKWLVGAVAVVAIAALGFFAARLMMPSPESAEPPALAGTEPPAMAGTDASSTAQPAGTSDDGPGDSTTATEVDPSSSAGGPAQDSGQGASASPESSPQSTGASDSRGDDDRQPSAEPVDGSAVRTSPPPRPSSAPPPPRTTSTPTAPQTTPRQTAPPQTTPTQAASPQTPPTQPAPPQAAPSQAAPSQAAPSQTAPPPSTASSAEAIFDAAAGQAYRTIKTGIRFRFEVEPENTLVKIQKRGDRSIVQGQVVRFEHDEDDARDLELPGSGEYLLTLVHPGYPEVVFYVQAGTSPSPHVIRLSMADAARSGARASRGAADSTIRVSRGVSFAGEPADAVVFVDGRRRGLASEWPGGGRGVFKARNSLKLRKGRHTIRVEAPGHAPQEWTVNVAPSARERVFQIVYRLEKSE